MTVFRDFVLASLDPPSVWQFYPSLEAAAAKQKEANAYNVKLVGGGEKGYQNGGEVVPCQESRFGVSLSLFSEVLSGTARIRRGASAGVRGVPGVARGWGEYVRAMRASVRQAWRGCPRPSRSTVRLARAGARLPFRALHPPGLIPDQSAYVP